MTIIPGYDCAIVNYIDRYLYKIQADCLQEWLEFSLEIVLNVSVWNYI